MTDEQQIIRANHAQQLLRDPLIEEVFQTMETDIVEEWKSSADPATREGAWRLLKTLELFKSRLRGLVENGELVKRSLETKEMGDL